MKFKKNLLKTLTAGAILIAMLSCSTIAQATTVSPGKLLKLDPITYRKSGYAYQGGFEAINGNNTDGFNFWKIYEYNSNGRTILNQNNAIYCLKMGVGFGSANGSATQQRNYNVYADMKNPGSDQSIINDYKSTLPSASNYNAILWILDNAYVPAPSENPSTEKVNEAKAAKEALLTNAGIPRTSALYMDINAANDLIDIAQQAAIWHFTNNDNYAINVINNLNLRTSSSDWKSIDEAVLGDIRGNTLISQVRQVFTYLVNQAEANKNSYQASTVASTITINATSARTSLVEDSYISGPYRISGTSDVTATLIGSNGSAITGFTFQNASGVTKTISALISANEDVYIKIPATNTTAANLEGATFKLIGNQKANRITYWKVASGNNEQPVAIIEPGETPEATTTLSLSNFDLALRKFITKINDVNVEVSREPVVSSGTIADLRDERVNTVTKMHTKDPLMVTTGDTVLYTIRIYNEGNIDGYASEVTDYLPEGLELKSDSTINRTYGWTTTDGKTIKTTKLGETSNLLRAFDGTTLDYKDLQIECTVTATLSENNQSMKNIAEITQDLDSNRNEITDRDSTPDNLTERQKNNYNPGTSTTGWGYEDDDDYEELIMIGQYFDLALRKFITKINDVNVEVSREPVITAQTISDLRNGRITTVTKTHTKDPLTVKTGDTVLYTIRIYNEGQVDGYAKEITDYLPEGLELKSDSAINSAYGWTTTDGKTIKTTKLADTLLGAFDGTTIDYADVEIECIVTASVDQSNQSMKNVAEITLDENEFDIDDIDSTPDNLTDNQKANYNPGTSTRGWGYEDDDDYEELVLPGRVFDLALRKYITKVNEKELIDTTGKYLREPTIDLTPLVNGTDTTAIYKHPKNPVGVAVGDIVEYTLRIYNEGEVDGYASEVTDYLPPQLEYINDEFNAGYGWIIDSTGRKATTEHLKKQTVDPEETLLHAFNGRELDYQELKIRCKVVSVQDLDKVITNIAEVTNFTDVNGNTILDRDSQKANVVLPRDEDLPDYKGKETNKSILNDSNYFYKGQQDDDDFEKLILEEFDLALRKFITSINDVRPEVSREPVVDVTKLANGTSTTATYTHPKNPLEVDTTDIVEYTLRIYNEGDIAGYANLVKDDIPDGLKFLPNDETNKEYRWVMIDKDGNATEDSEKAVAITTDYLSKEQGELNERDNLLQPFTNSRTTLDYKDLKVVFEVIAPSNYEGIITNKAQISDDSDENGNPVDDRDSTPDVWIENEDDQDVEHLKLSYFDLALRKFITAVNTTEITNRVPVFKITEDGKYVYEHTKEPVEVENGNIVTYTIRVFNEGTKDGYAKEVKDDLPEGLLYLPENEINKEYRWVMLDKDDKETDDISKAVSIKTDYLSKEQEDATGRNNLLTKFNPDSMKEPDHRDVKIAFKVTEPNTSDRILINKAQISDDSDKEGKPVIDIDSTPNKWIENEDDQDIEKVKVKYFDLALRKWVTQAIVIDEGKETVTNTGHKAEDDPEAPVKVEIKKGRLDKVVVKFRYKIRITNEGEIAGYCTEISDYIPQGLKFVAADNPKWKEVDGKVVTDQLKDKLLKPGETAEVEILLTWINGENNMGLKTNVAEISKDKNDSNTPDIDSVPNNKKPKEDDIDDAPVLLSIKTGIDENTPYVILIIGGLSVIGTATVLIKKYVL